MSAIQSAGSRGASSRSALIGLMRSAASSATTRSSITTPIFSCAPKRTATRSPMRASMPSGSEYSKSFGSGTSSATRRQKFRRAGKDLGFVDKPVGKRFMLV
jgi:hypothetical protein